MAIPLLVAGGIAAAGMIGGGIAAASGAGMNRRRRTSFGDSEQFDKDASNWGGRPGGLQDYSANLNYRRVGVEQRGANRADFSQSDWDRQQAGQARNGQNMAAMQIMDRARGAAPTIAEQQGAIAQRRMVAQNTALTAAARGPAALALSQQNAANTVANASGQISSDTAVNAATERRADEAAALGAYTTIRQGDQSAEGIAAQRSQFQAQQEQANRDSNDKRAMGYEQLDSDAHKSQLQSKMQQQQILGQTFTDADRGNQETAQNNAGQANKNVDRILGPIQNMGGAMGGMGGGQGSDVRMKAPVGGALAKAARPAKVGASAAPELTESGVIKGDSLDKTLGKTLGIKGTHSPGGPPSGDPNAPKMVFDPVQGWHMTGGDPQKRRAGLAAFAQEEADRQEEEDAVNADIDRQVKEQQQVDARQANDPAVGLERARGYRAAHPRKASPEDTASVDEEKGQAPGTEDFNRSQSTKPNAEPWYMTPVNPGTGLFGALGEAAVHRYKAGHPEKYSYNPEKHEWTEHHSDDRTKLAGAFQSGVQYAAKKSGSKQPIVVSAEDAPPYVFEAENAKQTREPTSFTRDRQPTSFTREEPLSEGQRAAVSAGKNVDPWAPQPQQRSKGTFETQYETPLTPIEEKRYQAWKKELAPNDSGFDYDYRGAFKSGVLPGEDGHWPDTFKKPNHPTFSNESKYAVGENAKRAGHWEGDTYVPPKPEAAPTAPGSSMFERGAGWKAPVSPVKKEGKTSMGESKGGSALARAARIDKSPIAEANRTMAGAPYAYRPEFTPEDQEVGEPNFGYMAQNLRQSPITATAVKRDPATGMDMVDPNKMLKVVASGVADLQRQNDEMRGTLSKVAGKKTKRAA